MQPLNATVNNYCECKIMLSVISVLRHLFVFNTNVFITNRVKCISLEIRLNKGFPFVHNCKVLQLFRNSVVVALSILYDL